MTGPKMAFKSIALVLALGVIFHGYLPVSAQTSVQAPTMANPPLFDYGSGHHDTEVKNMTYSVKLPLSNSVPYFGALYDEIYVSPQGFVAFGSDAKYGSTIRFANRAMDPSADTPMIAPFYFEAFEPVNNPDTYRGSMFYRQLDADNLNAQDPDYDEQNALLHWLGSYIQDAVINVPEDFQAKLVVVVTWDKVTDNANGQSNVGCTIYGNEADCPRVATFQVVIVSDYTHTYTIFNYDRMEIPLQSNYQSGCNGGEGRGWVSVLPCSENCKNSNGNLYSLTDLPKVQGSDQIGRFILDVGGDTIARGGCLPSGLQEGIMEIFPRTVGMFGGEKLQVSGRCLPKDTKIFCRFGNAQKYVTSEGAMINTMRGYCPVPLLTTIGVMDIAMSNFEGVWPAVNTITVVQPGRLGDPVPVPEEVKTEWLARDSSYITVPWDPALLSSSNDIRVEIKLIGYREIETNETSEVQYNETLQFFGSTTNGEQNFTFEVANYSCKANCDDYEIGLLEVGLPLQYYGDATDRVAIRFGPIPIGWYVNEALTEDMGSTWSDQKCREWHSADSKDETWLEDLPPCPCNLDQALADFGRWQPDPGCNLFNGSVCHYHKNAKHCVRSVVPTEKTGSGNQCCYNYDGTLRYSQLSYQGSTPDRSHAWGALPYGEVNRVPDLSHWKHDVISFYYCCLWNDYKRCDLYMEQRPTADCQEYDVPAIAFLYGDPHITTFDGQNYHFGGAGDFWLIKDNRQEYPLQIQGRFEPRKNSWDLGLLDGKTSWKPKALTALAITGGSDVVIEISLAPENSVHQRDLDIRVDGTRLYFLDKESMWQTFDDFFIFNNALDSSLKSHDNFTVLLTRMSVGINVAAVNGLLQVKVALPPEMKSDPNRQQVRIQGLLGTYDGDKDNDFTTKSNFLLPSYSSKEEIFRNFALSWKVEPNEDILFPSRMDAQPADPAHYYFEITDIPTGFSESPSPSQVQAICGEDSICAYDYLITGDQNVGQATIDAQEAYGYLHSSANRVENCGLPDMGSMAILNSTNFSVDEGIQVTGCAEGYQFEGEATFKCVKETLELAVNNSREDYGYNRTYVGDDVTYIIHWMPKPSPTCFPNPEDFSGDDDDDDDVDVGLIVGIVIGVIAGIILIAVLSVIIYRMSKKKSFRPGRRQHKRTKERDPQPPSTSGVQSV